MTWRCVFAAKRNKRFIRGDVLPYSHDASSDGGLRNVLVISPLAIKKPCKVLARDDLCWLREVTHIEHEVRKEAW